MTREVPRDQPLSDEDREYLHARGYHDQVEMIDQDQPGNAEVDIVDDDDEPENDDYDTWQLVELQDEARRRSLPSSGTKQQLAERLRASDEAQAQQ